LSDCWTQNAGGASFSLEQMLQLFAIACESQRSTGDQWSLTPRELADEVIKQGKA